MKGRWKILVSTPGGAEVSRNTHLPTRRDWGWDSQGDTVKETNDFTSSHKTTMNKAGTTILIFLTVVNLVKKLYCLIVSISVKIKITIISL
jgi:hypothetical protein